jgi:dihydrofolate reductase
VAELAYFINCSLDGYIEDASGSIEFTEPSEEVHDAARELVQPAGTYLYGRRMYETMAVWETDEEFISQPGFVAEFAAVWQAADKIVYSTTLTETVTSRTTLEPRFDAGAVRAMKASATSDIMIAGPTLAAEAFRAGLVDRVHLFVAPVSVGGGKPALPRDQHVDLALVGARPFASGTLHLEYRVVS